MGPGTTPTFPFPVLDLRDLDAGPTQAAAFRDALRKATHEVGFFYLVGTAVTRDLEERLLARVREFFALGEEEKREIEGVKRYVMWAHSLQGTSDDDRINRRPYRSHSHSAPISEATPA
jgi:isopenicillin N synthase-like dioxygenase